METAASAAVSRGEEGAIDGTLGGGLRARRGLTFSVHDL
jgi:hypothetical protein